ncbi:unnamed protein product [Amoebophrya sp. A120]|nr:unnamed protein product [Amoebophrya sp. A120]|eukprot:GSA120T00016248001.1
MLVLKPPRKGTTPVLLLAGGVVTTNEVLGVSALQESKVSNDKKEKRGDSLMEISADGILNAGVEDISLEDDDVAQASPADVYPAPAHSTVDSPLPAFRSEACRELCRKPGQRQEHENESWQQWKALSHFDFFKRVQGKIRTSSRGMANDGNEFLRRLESCPDMADIKTAKEAELERQAKNVAEEAQKSSRWPFSFLSRPVQPPALAKTLPELLREVDQMTFSVSSWINPFLWRGRKSQRESLAGALQSYCDNTVDEGAPGKWFGMQTFDGVDEHDSLSVAENRPLPPSEETEETSSAPATLFLREYVGEVEGGMQNGYGKMVYHTNAVHCKGSNELSYEGQWSKSKRSGKGTMRYCDGSVFEGEWKDDKPWKGKLTLSDGSFFEGQVGRENKGKKLRMPYNKRVYKPPAHPKKYEGPAPEGACDDAKIVKEHSFLREFEGTLKLINGKEKEVFDSDWIGEANIVWRCSDGSEHRYRGGIKGNKLHGGWGKSEYRIFRRSTLKGYGPQENYAKNPNRYLEEIEKTGQWEENAFISGTEVLMLAPDFRNTDDCQYENGAPVVGFKRVIRNGFHLTSFENKADDTSSSLFDAFADQLNLLQYENRSGWKAEEVRKRLVEHPQHGTTPATLPAEELLAPLAKVFEVRVVTKKSSTEPLTNKPYPLPQKAGACFVPRERVAEEAVAQYFPKNENGGGLPSTSALMFSEERTVTLMFAKEQNRYWSVVDCYLVPGGTTSEATARCPDEG